MSDNNQSDGKFTIQPKEDPLYKEIVPRSRHNTAKDKSLSHGARLLYDFLTDYSLWPNHNVKPGVVRLSNGDLARALGTSTRVIQRWKAELRHRGLIFTTDKFLRNCWPVTTFHVVAICGQPSLPFTTDLEDGYVSDDDSVQRSNRRRLSPRFRDPKTGKWSNPEKPIAGESPADANCRAPHVNNVVPPTPNLSCDARQIWRAPHVNGDVPRTPEPAMDARQICRARHAKSDVGGTTEMADKGETPDVRLESPEGSFKRSTVSTLKKPGNGTGKGIDRERHFLLDVGAVMETWRKGSSKAELANSGGWWRMAFRANPELMEKVLGEIRGMVRENKITDSPGAAAVDYWKRMGGELPKA